MPKTYSFEAKIHKTTDKKKLVGNKVKHYEYGTINIRSPELARHIGKKAKVSVKIEKEPNNRD